MMPLLRHPLYRRARGKCARPCRGNHRWVHTFLRVSSVQCGNKGLRADFPQNGDNSRRCAECGLWRPFRRIDAWLRDDSSAKRRCSQRNRYTTITTNGITVLRTRIITTRFQELLEPPTARTSAAVCTVDDAMSHTSRVPRRRACARGCHMAWPDTCGGGAPAAVLVLPCAGRCCADGPRSRGALLSTSCHLVAARVKPCALERRDNHIALEFHSFPKCPG